MFQSENDNYLNALSVDIEDYFQVSAFEKFIPTKDWESYPSRVVQNTNRILEILDDVGIKATFFVLGWIAERHPTLILTIQKLGHEIASHGYAHKLITNQSPEEFSIDLEKSIKIIEDITGEKVIGYRAPSYSVTPKTIWAIDIMKNQGLKYDSSIFPIVHDLGGFRNAPYHPYEIKEDFWEMPLTVFKFIGFNLPIAGGGYLRLYPYWCTKLSIKSINKKGRPAVTYIHPWELDIEQPKISGADFFSKFRHYQNLKKTETKIRALFNDFNFAPVKDVLHRWISIH